MRIAALAATLLLCISVPGVARTRLYPICFYTATRPNQTELINYYVPMLIAALRAAAYLSSRAKVVASPDGKWLLADTSDSQNARIAKVWARLGCIGDASNSDRVGTELACFDYVYKVISRAQPEHIDQAKIAETWIAADDLLNSYSLYCKTVATNSDP